MRVRALAAWLLLAVSPLGLAGPVDRIEPPFWWTGFEHEELQVLVHGHETGTFEAAIDYPGVELARTVRVASDNYLFLYLRVTPEARPGTIPIRLSRGGTSVVLDYELRPRTPGHVGTYDSSDVIYLLTPDRFANGRPANDTIDGYADALDRDDDYGRHGGDLEGIRQRLDYLADMGFTQLWLNPVLDNAMQRSSYHGYSTTDYYKVDPRFGSNEEYRELVAAARARGIGIIMDMIVNHIGSEHWWMDDLPTATWLNAADTRPMSTHARTTNQDPHASDFDKAGHADGWFADTMPDLNQRDPLLADYLVQNAIWWIEYAGLSGVRQDTYPYPDKHFMTEWTRRIMQEYPGFNMVGEEWSPSPAIVSYWQRGKQNHDGYLSYLPGVMDFPLQISLAGVLQADEPPWGSVWTPVYEIMGHDFLYPEPMNLVIFPDNHDMSRIFTQLDENEALWRMAIAFYATMRGIPQIFYGTEVLMSHPGTDSHGALRAEFPGGWADHRKNAFTGEGLTAQELAAQAFMKKLLNWRKQAPVIHTGKLMQFTPVGNVYCYFRYDGNDTVMAVFNRAGESVELDTARFAERLDGFTSGTDVISGRRVELAPLLELDPMSVMILELE